MDEIRCPSADWLMGPRGWSWRYPRGTIPVWAPAQREGSETGAREDDDRPAPPRETNRLPRTWQR